MKMNKKLILERFGRYLIAYMRVKKDKFEKIFYKMFNDIGDTVELLNLESKYFVGEKLAKEAGEFVLKCDIFPEKLVILDPLDFFFDIESSKNGLIEQLIGFGIDMEKICGQSNESGAVGPDCGGGCSGRVSPASQWLGASLPRIHADLYRGFR